MKRVLETWSVIGGGNGGQALAGFLGLSGKKVRLYDIFPATVEAINQAGGVSLEGAVEGFGPVEATGEIREAVEGADIVMLTLPSNFHGEIARQIAPYIKEGSLIYLHPGMTCGSLEVRNEIIKSGGVAPTIIESMTLLYACRALSPGRVQVYGIKEALPSAVLPATAAEEILPQIQEVFPQVTGVETVLETGLENLNAVVHPTPSLLNLANIESEKEWYYYYDGITPTIGRFVEAIDRERLAIGQSFGIELTDILSWYQKLYNVTAETVRDAVKRTEAYRDIRGQKSIETRYVTEDIATGLVPFSALGEVAGVPTRRIDTVIDLGSQIVGRDFRKEGRHLGRLGIEGRSKEEILNLVRYGT